MSNYLKSSVVIIAVFFIFLSISIVNAKTKPKLKSYRMWVIATAYCPCSKCCGEDSPGITATQTDAYKAGVAVDPNIIPKGSHIDIPGYNRGPNENGSWILCDDVGGAIKGNRIDVRFKTHQEAIEWGVREILIRVHVEK